MTLAWLSFRKAFQMPVEFEFARDSQRKRRECDKCDNRGQKVQSESFHESTRGWGGQLVEKLAEFCTGKIGSFSGFQGASRLRGSPDPLGQSFFVLFF
mmetsp:Transcript_18356/g.38343  ORF Transcript_18356/g.38343 Transcript_18356/m.38343 type:complete len:98 (+) Transcript_18356:205-498(+)